MTIHAHTNQVALDAYTGSGGGISSLYMQSFRNLKIDCASSTQVIIRSGSAVVADDGSSQILAGADKTLDITASGANGLDTGSEASNTWYYIYLIMKDDGTVNGLLSASATSPTLPSGYTKKRLIGAVRNDGSSNFVTFKQVASKVYLSDGANNWNLIVNVNTVGVMTAVNVSNNIPSAIAPEGMFEYYCAGSGGMGWNGTNNLMSAQTGQEQPMFIPLVGNFVYYASNGGGAYISVTGYTLNL